MEPSPRPTLVGVFTDAQEARKAVEELRAAGFTEAQIGVAARDVRGTEDAPAAVEAPGTYAEEAGATGLLAGAGVGGLWAIGIAAGFLPAIGPAIAGGLLASLLASAAGGAVVGGLVGVLAGLGVPEEQARYYEGELHAGRTVVTVRAGDRYPEALAVLRRHGAYDWDTRLYGAAGRTF